MNQETVIKEPKEQKLPKTSIPDFYVNSVSFGISVYDVQMNFGVQSGPDSPMEDVAVIRMSPQHALVMTKMLLKNLQSYEKQVGKINLPQELLEEMGIEEGDSNGDSNTDKTDS